MSTFSERISALSPEKRRLFQALHEEKQKLFLEPAITSRQQTEGFWPVSFAQQRFWFFDQLVPGNVLYNTVAISLRIMGPLSVPTLEQCLQELVHRHEILRTTFHFVDGNPVQTICSPQPVNMIVLDLQAVPAPEREREARESIAADARRPFDLSQGPLFRVHLMQTGPEEHLFFLTMHHIITDHWSNGVLIGEIVALYNAFLVGEPSPLPELPIQYADFALWQRKWLQGERLEKLLAYWRVHLGGELPRLDIPGSTPHTTRNSSGATHRLRVSSRLLEGLRALGQQSGSTLSMTLLAAFAVLLHGYTDQTDMLIGTPLSVRNRLELEGMPGCFLNTLVFRLDVSGNPPFLELVKRVREETLAAYQHQDLPFERLVEEIQPARTLGEVPLIQVAFNFVVDKEALQPLAMSGVRLALFEMPDGMADLDLLLSVIEDAQGLNILFQYRRDLFPAELIATMTQQYYRLLERVVAYAQQPCRELARTIVVESEKYRQAAIEGESSPAATKLLPSSNLTRNQFLFWMGQKLQPQVPLYNSISVFTFSKALNPQHFQQAFAALCAQVDVLRTVIEEYDGVPVQKVLPVAPGQMEYIDLSQETDAHTSFDLWLQKRCTKNFDLSKNLVDSVLLKLAPEEFIWYITQHHIITDKWSTAIVCRRLLALYDLSLHGELGGEPDVYAPFSAYVAYERAHRSSPEGITVEEYWQQKMKDLPEPMNFYGVVPSKRTTLIERVSYNLGAERTRRLKSLVTGADFFVTLDLSLFQIFATVLFAYLYRVSNNRRLSIGSPFQMRLAAFEDTVGSFAETRPLCVTIEHNETFHSLLQKVKAEIFDALKYAPWSTPNLNNTCYDVLLNYHPHITFPEMVKHTWHHVGHGNDSLNLQVLGTDEEGSLQLLFDFHRDVFPQKQYGMVIRHFLGMIDAFIEDRAQSLASIDFLSQDEKQQILAESKGETCDLKDNCPHQLFERQARHTPDAIAVVYDDIQLSYAYLDQEAKRLAARLQTSGVGLEQRVGLCMTRSPEMVIAILGILKTGGAYVPLDPAYPKERLASMIEAARISVLVTNVEAMFSETTQHIVTVDSSTASGLSAWSVDTSLPEDGSHLFYVIFTSGSTGQPKGVGISQRSFTHLLNWYTTAFALTASDRTLIISSLSFDLTQKNIFAPLAVGGVVHLLAAENTDIPAIFRALQEQAITTMNCTPSLFYLLADYKEHAILRDCQALRYAFLGGESVSSQKIKSYGEEAASQVEIVNTYGPTECTDVSSYHRLHHLYSEITTPVPIGRPILNAQILILNEQLQLVPEGVVGELYLAGDGVGRGYINDSSFTAATFLPDPFSKRPGGRLYKTGDRARTLPNGDIEFLGRVDFQVKVRGFRVELTEIETALNRHPAVRESIVLTREERMVAYIIPGPEAHPTDHELCAFLKKELPEYMLPSVFVRLSALPLTENNKVDRQALLEMDLSQAISGIDRVLPRNTEERIIAAIWSELLKLDVAMIGIHDTFFHLGGHSLLAIQLAFRLGEAFGVEMPLVTLFQAPTIAELAIAVLQAKMTQLDSAQLAQLLGRLEPGAGAVSCE